MSYIMTSLKYKSDASFLGREQPEPGPPIFLVTPKSHLWTNPRVAKTFPDTPA